MVFNITIIAILYILSYLSIICEMMHKLFVLQPPPGAGQGGAGAAVLAARHPETDTQGQYGHTWLHRP